MKRGWPVWHQARPGRLALTLPAHPPTRPPTHSRRPPTEGILLCDVERGWEVRYANSAFTRLTGVGRQQAEAAALWSLFGLPAGGASAADVQAAVRSSKPLTLPIGLLPGSGSCGPGAASSPPGAAGGVQPEASGLFVATFSPASSPEFRPDQPAIAIPIAPAPPGTAASGSGPSGGGSGGVMQARLWFVTLQRPGGGQPGRASSPGSASGTGGSLDSSGTTVSPINRLRPASMQDVQLGPLLGAGASGR